MNHTANGHARDEAPGYANASLLAALEMILSDHPSGVLTSALVGGTHRKLQVVDGAVVAASSLVPEERLLSRLRDNGRLTEDQLAEALTAIEQSAERAGQWAIDHAKVPEDVVLAALTEQIRDALATLLADPRHPVRFLPIPDQVVESPHPSVPITEAIPAAILAVEVATLRRNYPLDDDSTFRPAVTPWPLAANFTFDEEAATVLGLVETGRSLAEIARLAALSTDAVHQRLFLLAYLGLITPDKRPPTPRDGPARSAPPETDTEAASAPPGANEIATAAAPPAEEVEAEAPPLSEEAQAVMVELRGLERRIGSMDPFSLLRVNRHHPLAEIKRSYHRLSKRLHPDVVRGLGLPDELIAVADRVTQAMTAAYQTLSDPKQRAAEINEHDPPPRTTASDPDSVFANAKAAITARDYERAARLLTSLIERKPDQADYHLYLAAACIQLRGRKREAEQELKRAAHLAPSDPRPYVALGDLYRDGHMEKKAAASYREALRWDPRQQHAKRALEAIEAEANRHEGGLGGLLGRLRKG